MSLLSLHTAQDFNLRLNAEYNDWVTRQDKFSCNRLLNTYDYLLQKIHESSNASLDIEAIKFFAPICEASLKSDVNIDHQILDKLLSNLSRPKILSKIVLEPNSGKALSWFTCTMAAKYVLPKKKYGAGDLLNQSCLVGIVEQWTKRPLNYDGVPRLDSVVKHLYGDMCWELMACPIDAANYDRLVETVKEIAALNLPLLLSDPAKRDAGIANQLPSDFNP